MKTIEVEGKTKNILRKSTNQVLGNVKKVEGMRILQASIISTLRIDGRDRSNIKRNKLTDTNNTMKSTDKPEQHTWEEVNLQVHFQDQTS